MNQEYSYENAGFSPFLTRSIDDRGGVNLDDLAGMAGTRELNYDQSPTTGALGSSFRSGTMKMDGVNNEFLIRSDNGEEIVRIDQNGILISEHGIPRGRFGFKDSDFAIKVSQKGKDVLSAADNDQVMSSDFNLFKIVDAKTVSLTSTGAPTGASPVTAVYTHNLGYLPGLVAFTTDTNGFRFALPYTAYNATTGAIQARIYAQIESDRVVFVFQDFVGTGVFVYDIKFYLVRESAS